MNLDNAIKDRRSIRKFQTKVISRELVEDILNYGILAPSSKNKQPWYFVILKNTFKDNVANLMIDYANNNIINSKNNSVKETARVIKEADTLILLLKDKNNNCAINYNLFIGDYLSIGACVENICLRATDLGLGTLWIRDIIFVADDIMKMLKYEELELNCAISLGYPNEFPSPRPRKSLKKIMEWYE